MINVRVSFKAFNGEHWIKIDSNKYHAEIFLWEPPCYVSKLTLSSLVGP